MEKMQEQYSTEGGRKMYVDKGYKRLKKRRYPYWLAVPGITFFVLFFIIPSVMGLILSLFNMNGYDFSKAVFIGIENYKNAFVLPTMRRAIINSFIFSAVTTFFKVAFGLMLAVMLNQKLKSSNLLRTVFFSPAVVNSIAVGLIFKSLMHPGKGLIDTVLNSVNLEFLAKNWLGDPSLAIYSVSFIEIWKWSGFTMVIFLSGMQAVSSDYYEAAKIDGADGWQKFKYITFPLILPSFNNALIINLVGGLKVFDLVQATTQGGPGTATEVFSTLMYKSFGSGRFGEGCAVAILLSVIIAVFAIPTYAFIEKREVIQ